MKLPVFIASFFISLAAWLVISWPLPLHLDSAISSSSVQYENAPPREMIAGDHLQFLYRFRLVEDMLFGETEWGMNPYEFNTGPGQDRKQPGALYVPFSIFFALLSKVSGPAAAYNLTGFVTLWLSMLFTWLTLRRFTANEVISACFSALCVLIPYRYYNLMGGSPTGLSQLWPCMLFYGIDSLLRNRRTAGAWASGLAIIFASWTDMKVFYFMMLALIPSVTGLWLYHHGFKLPTRTLIRKTAFLMIPVAVAMILSGIYMWNMNRLIVDSVHMSSGRTFAEAALFSPKPADLFSLRPSTPGTHAVYIGWMIMSVITLGWLASAVRALRARKLDRTFVTLSALVVMTVFIVIIGLGPNGIRNGALFDLCRRWLPSFDRIRQPARIYILLPTLLSLAGAIAATVLMSRLPKRAVLWTCAALTLGMGFEYARHVQPELSILNNEQLAYAAVAATGTDEEPARAVAIPLWPGDTHWSSLYEHHAITYRIRMVNGYSPIVPKAYYDEIFLTYRGLNSGAVIDAELDALLDREIDHIIFHENAFPEKVSPFPALYTLQRFIEHPRLTFVVQDGPVWTFRIESEPAAGGMDEWTSLLAVDTQFPARSFDLKRTAGSEDQDAADSLGGVALRSTDDQASGRRAGVFAKAPMWHVLAKGTGTIQPQFEPDDGTAWIAPAVDVSHVDWEWLSFAMPPNEDYTVGRFRINGAAGDVRVQSAFFTDGSGHFGHNEPAYRYPAPGFFHAGHTSVDDRTVVIKPGREPRGRIFYGPRLPYPRGAYRVEMIFDSSADAGAKLGTWVWDTKRNNEGDAETDVTAGEPAVLNIRIGDARQQVFSFHYTAEHPLEIREVVIERVAD